MKKKIWAIIAGAAALCLALAACGDPAESGHNHEYSDKYEFSDARHWQVCALCGETTEKAEHVAEWITDKEASDIEDGARRKVCAVCGYLTASEKIHTFTREDHDGNFLAAAATVEGAARYYYSCIVCGESENDPAHTFAYGEPLTPTEHSHTYNELVWESDETGHWRPATCEHKSEKGFFAVHGEAAWTHVEEQGADKHEKRCPDCNYLIETGNCVYGDLVTTDDSGHYKACATCGDKKDEGAHEWDTTADGADLNGWVVTRPATESEAGLKHRVCSYCGFDETADIPSLGHEHSYGDWQSDDGKHWKECSCGEKSDEQAHTVASWTETDEDYHGGTCSVCGKAAKAAHDYGEWSETKAPTLDADGEEERACTAVGCGHKQTRSVARLITKGFSGLFAMHYDDQNVRAVAEDTTDGYKITVNDSDGVDWHIKVARDIATEPGAVYEITYKFSSTQSGDGLVKIEMGSDAVVLSGGDHRAVSSENDNVFTGVFIAKNAVTYTDLQLGKLSNGTVVVVKEITFTKCDYTPAAVIDLTAEDPMDGWGNEGHVSTNMSYTVNGGKITVNVNDSWNNKKNDGETLKDSWDIRVCFGTGITITEGRRYVVSATVESSSGHFDLLFRKGAGWTSDYTGLFFDGSNESVTHSAVFTADATNTLSVWLQVGQLPANGAIEIEQITVTEISDALLQSAQRTTLIHAVPVDPAPASSVDGGLPEAIVNDN